MEARVLGQGPPVSMLGLGCTGMSEFYGTTDEREASATIHRVLALEVTFLDTADMYRSGTTSGLLAGRSNTA